MAGRIQDSDVKTVSEVGAASRLINDTKIYVTGSGLNKTLFAAIDDGDLGSGSGSSAVTVTSVKTSAYTAAVNELVLVNPTSGAFTVTLPTAVGISGQKIKVMNVGTSWNNACTIDGNGSETISGSTTFPIYTNLEAIEIVSDGANWILIDHSLPSNRSTPTVHTPGAVTTAPTEPSNATHNIYYFWREGRWLNIVHDYRVATASGGSNGSGTYLWTLPQSLTASTSVTASTGTASSGLYNGYSQIGSGMAFNSTVINNAHLGILMYDSTRFFCQTISNNSVISSSNIAWVNAGGTVGISIRARIMIDGWRG